MIAGTAHDQAGRGVATSDNCDGSAANVFATDVVAEITQLSSAIEHDLHHAVASLLDPAWSDERAREALMQRTLAPLAEASKRARRVTSIMRAFSELAGANGSSLAVVNVGETLTSAVRTVSSSTRDAKVVCEFDDQLRVFCNPERLKQVFVHLLTNAVEAVSRDARANPSIRIAGWRTADERTVIEISDSGDGMSHTQTEHAFDAFFTTKSEGRGVGLGLTLSQLLVQSWGGSMVLTSRATHGTSVRIDLPSRPPPGEPERRRGA